jgi:hypothetical protein
MPTCGIHVSCLLRILNRRPQRLDRPRKPPPLINQNWPTRMPITQSTERFCSLYSFLRTPASRHACLLLARRCQIPWRSFRKLLRVPGVTLGRTGSSPSLKHAILVRSLQCADCAFACTFVHSDLLALVVFEFSSLLRMPSKETIRIFDLSCH